MQAEEKGVEPNRTTAKKFLFMGLNVSLVVHKKYHESSEMANLFIYNLFLEIFL